MSFDVIPIFKPYQALTADHLNDLREYLDNADRLTRRALVGIGIQCGFTVDVDASARVLISKGVAVTSEGWLIAEESVVCDRVRPYMVPLPTGDEVTPDQVNEARYPFLFPDGENQIPAWELLGTEVVVSANEPSPDPITDAFLADKTVMLFLECTEESLKNCDINDCSDRGAELRFVLRRLLIPRADADAMMVQSAAAAGYQSDRASHPSLALNFLRVEDLGLARLSIGTFPALFARVLQIAARFSAHLPQALRDAYAAYDYLLADMYPTSQFPDGPFPDDYFGNLWGNLAVQPYLVQYFYHYMLDVAAAYNEFVDVARRYDADCLPSSARFPKHVLLGDPLSQPLGYVNEVSTPAQFASFDPLSASTGFGVRPVPPHRRTGWFPADAGPVRDELRSLFHRLTLLAHSFQLRGLLGEEVRITPSRHDEARLGERCIPPYYAFNEQSDLFRVWSPVKTRSNLLSTVYAHRFSTRDANHPYLYRVDGETFYGVAGHVGKNVYQAMAELTETKRVLGLDFAIRPVWMGLALASDANGLKLDETARGRAFDAARRLILCRMGDFEVMLLAVLAALFAFLVFILRGVGGQRTINHALLPKRLAVATNAPEGQSGGGALGPGGAEAEARAPEADPAGRELARKDMERLVSMLRVEAVRRPDEVQFNALRLDAGERLVLKDTSIALLQRYRDQAVVKGDATKVVVPNAKDEELATFYLAVKDDQDGNLFDRVRAKTLELNVGTDQTGATDRVYNAVALMDATENLMASTSVKSLAEFDFNRFETDYADFSAKLDAYAVTAPVDTDDVDAKTANTNIAVSDFAPAVAAQTTALSGAGLFGEAQRRMLTIFEELTLEGLAKRNPGLEHRAGVPRGGTLVLPYVAKVELAALMQLAAPQLDRLSGALNLNQAGGIAAAIANATAELLKEAGPSGENPLTDFVVLGDFCLSSKCCDDDCTDVIPEDELPGNLFDFSTTGTMGVAPVIPSRTNVLISAPQPAIGQEVLGVLGDIGVGPLLRRRAQIPATPGRTAPSPAPAAPAPEPSRPTPLPTRNPASGETPPDIGADRTPTRRPVPQATIEGQVLGTGGASRRVIPQATVVARNSDTGTTVRIPAPEGTFRRRVPAGNLDLVAEAPNMVGTPRSANVEPGETATVNVRMVRER